MVNHLFVCIKIGDQKNDPKYCHMGIKDGMIVDYIDPNDPNYGKDWFPANGARKVFLWLKVPYTYKENLNNWIGEIGDRGDIENYRQRRRLLQLHLLPRKIQEKIRTKTDNGKVIDLTQENAALLDPDGTRHESDKWTSADVVLLFKSTATLNPAAVDENSISAGNYNIGSGETYTTVAAFISDLANLSGHLTGTVTSAITNNGLAQINGDLGTYTLTITSDTDHQGDPTAGHLLSWNGTNTGIDFVGTGSAGCKFVLDKLNMKRTGASGNDIIVNSTDSDVEIYFSNLLMDGNSVATRGIWLGTNQPTVYVYNCKIWDVVNFGLQFAGSFTGTVENVIVYSCGSHGYYINGIAVTFNNCIGYDNTGTEFFGPGGATGNNCAYDGTGNIGFSSETGTVDGLTDSDFTSVTDTETDFLNIDSDSSLYQAGTDGTITGHDSGINGVEWLSGSWDIGPFAVPPIALETTISDTDTIVARLIDTNSVRYMFCTITEGSNAANTLTKDTKIDGITLNTLFEKMLAMIDGNFVEDSQRNITFYKRDNTTEVIKAQTNSQDTTRTRKL